MTSDPPGPANPPRVCDNRSVGVIITDRFGRYLLFDRNTPTAGAAPCAGHGDTHGTDRDAARAEVREEVGLTADTLTPVASGWRANACRRLPGPRGTGHQWSVYRATAHGELNPSLRETRNARWISRRALQDLYARTLAYADGRVTAAQFDAAPGLEPVWALWFTLAGALDATARELQRVELLTRDPAVRMGPLGPLCPLCEGAGHDPGNLAAPCPPCGGTGIDFGL